MQVDIGMRLAPNDERVWLELRRELRPFSQWVSYDRGLFSAYAFPGSTPTAEHFSLHRKILEALKTEPAPET